MTYRLVLNTVGDKSYPGIQCLRCGFTSYHPKDVAEKYCIACHRFHEDPPPVLRIAPTSQTEGQ
jgi:hypothetical protein